MKRPLLALLVTLAVAMPAVAGAATAPTISITSPVGGSSFSRSTFDTIPVSGVASFDVAPAEDRVMYLRGTGCGATAVLWISTETGSDEYDGCGSQAGLPTREVLGGTLSFTSQDGVPVMLDASKNVTGQVRGESWVGPGVPGVGQVKADVDLYGTKANNQTVVIGSGVFETLNTGTDGVNIPYTFDIAASLDRVVLTSLRMDVLIHGVNWNSGNLGLEGDSRFTLPIFDPGRIDVSSDSATFSAAKTVQAVLNSDGTWTAEVVTPSAGTSRKIYARAVQAGVTTNATPVSITVTA
jgi:hypothetical protein